MLKNASGLGLPVPKVMTEGLKLASMVDRFLKVAQFIIEYLMVIFK